MFRFSLGDEDPNVARVLSGDKNVSGGHVSRLWRKVGRVFCLQPVALHLEKYYLWVWWERGQRDSAGHGCKSIYNMRNSSSNSQNFQLKLASDGFVINVPVTSCRRKFCVVMVRLPEINLCIVSARHYVFSVMAVNKNYNKSLAILQTFLNHSKW